jgi:hypothetical protein
MSLMITGGWPTVLLDLLERITTTFVKRANTLYVEILHVTRNQSTNRRIIVVQIR